MERLGFDTITVGEVVARDFSTANILDEFGIDFCCGGSKPLGQACADAGVELNVVVKRLEEPQVAPDSTPTFYNWPLDLLVDYVIKIFHRGWDVKAERIRELAHKVARVHGNKHPELLEVRDQFDTAMTTLAEHFNKEEQVLFPYIYDLVAATDAGMKAPAFHCRDVSFPIAVMEDEHEIEGERFRHMRRITGEFSVPADGCNSYRLLMQQLSAFEHELHRHIHFENNLIFPRAIALQAANL